MEQLVTDLAMEEEEEGVSGIGVTVNMRDSCLGVGVEEWAGGGGDRRLVSKPTRSSENSEEAEDIGLETEKRSEDNDELGLKAVEDIEDDDDDLDMHLEGGEDTGYRKSSGSLFTVRSKGAWLSRGT